MINYLSIEQAKIFFETNEYILIDVREPNEWEQGHLKDAILISKNNLIDVSRDSFSDLDQCLILYCSAGIRAKWAAQQLLDLGYKNIQVLYPGYVACVQDGFLINKPDKYKK